MRNAATHSILTRDHRVSTPASIEMPSERCEVISGSGLQCRRLDRVLDSHPRVCTFHREKLNKGEVFRYVRQQQPDQHQILIQLVEREQQAQFARQQRRPVQFTYREQRQFAPVQEVEEADEAVRHIPQLHRRQDPTQDNHSLVPMSDDLTKQIKITIIHLGRG